MTQASRGGDTWIAARSFLEQLVDAGRLGAAEHDLAREALRRGAIQRRPRSLTLSSSTVPPYVPAAPAIRRVVLVAAILGSSILVSALMLLDPGSDFETGGTDHSGPVVGATPTSSSADALGGLGVPTPGDLSGPVHLRLERGRGYLEHALGSIRVRVLLPGGAAEERHHRLLLDAGSVLIRAAQALEIPLAELAGGDGVVWVSFADLPEASSTALVVPDVSLASVASTWARSYVSDRFGTLRIVPALSIALTDRVLGRTVRRERARQFTSAFGADRILEIPELRPSGSAIRPPMREARELALRAFSDDLIDRWRPRNSTPIDAETLDGLFESWARSLAPVSGSSINTGIARAFETALDDELAELERRAAYLDLAWSLDWPEIRVAAATGYVEAVCRDPELSAALADVLSSGHIPDGARWIPRCALIVAREAAILRGETVGHQQTGAGGDNIALARSIQRTGTLGPVAPFEPRLPHDRESVSGALGLGLALWLVSSIAGDGSDGLEALRSIHRAERLRGLEMPRWWLEEVGPALDPPRSVTARIGRSDWMEEESR